METNKKTPVHINITGYLLEIVTVDESRNTYRTDIAVSHSRILKEAISDITLQVRTFYLIRHLLALDSKWNHGIKPGNYDSLESLADDLSEAYLQYTSYTDKPEDGEVDHILRVGSVKIYRIIDNNVKLIYNI